MDLQMPEMNGVEATAAIRAEFPDARIIVLTTYPVTSRWRSRSRLAQADTC